MKPSQIEAKQIDTGLCDIPGKMGLAASSGTESVQIFFDTTQAPLVAANILLASQDGVRAMDPESLVAGITENVRKSLSLLPDAIDISLAADGDVLCINVGSGALCFKLTKTAKEKIKDLGATVDQFRR